MPGKTRRIYVPEDAGEGCWMEANKPLAVYRKEGVVYVKCGSCGEAHKDPDPWDQCKFCGKLIPPPESDDG